MSDWNLVYTSQAQKDAKRLAASGLREKTQKLLDLLAKDPFSKPPPCEKLVGDLAGAIRRIDFRGGRAYPYNVKVREIVRMLEDDGWLLVRTRGSHHQYKHSTKPGLVTIPGNRNDELAPGTLNSILKQAGLKP